jgi:hypothetical protein
VPRRPNAWPHPCPAVTAPPPMARAECGQQAASTDRLAVHLAQSGGRSQAADRTRTDDPVFTRDVLYQLSYGGVCPARPRSRCGGSHRRLGAYEGRRAASSWRCSETKQPPFQGSRRMSFSLDTAARVPRDPRRTPRNPGGLTVAERAHVAIILVCDDARRAVRARRGSSLAWTNLRRALHRLGQISVPPRLSRKRPPDIQISPILSSSSNSIKSAAGRSGTSTACAFGAGLMNRE